MFPETCEHRGKPVVFAYEGTIKHPCQNPVVGLMFCENAIRAKDCPYIDGAMKDLSDGVQKIFRDAVGRKT